MSSDRITIRRPDDLHVHLRDEQMLETVLPYTARQFARAIVMPNLSHPIRTAKDASLYRQRILRALPASYRFEPLMTCYLTDNTDPEDIARGFSDAVFTAAKLYPAHATTNAHHGVTSVSIIARVLERMEKIGMPLLIHGESTDPKVDIFDREQVFIEQTLVPLMESFQGLRIVLEHITTSFAADFVRSHKEQRLAATITPHHLLLNRNAMFQGGLKPHTYCLPVAKRERDRLALRKAATSGAPCFFLGTDSAPHPKEAKESECGCAGIFCAPVALETYAQVFDEEDALDQFEQFASFHGARFYNLPLNEGTITLHRRKHAIPASVEVGDSCVRVFHGGQFAPWAIDYRAEERHCDPDETARTLSSLPTPGSRSAASPWRDQRPPHLPCGLGELPSAVLFPGDPGRVDRFANVLANFRIVGQNREFRIAVGTFNGVELGVCSTGIGGPSTEIALVEAAELGCKYALRVGGTGALEPSIPVGTLLIVETAIRGGGAAAFYADSQHLGKANPQMVSHLCHAAQHRAMPAHLAVVASTDSYYAGQGRPFPNADGSLDSVLQRYRNAGATALDMEAESILVIGERLGMKTGVILAVHANRYTDDWLEEFGETQDRMIRVACEALSNLVRSDARLQRSSPAGKF